MYRARVDNGSLIPGVQAPKPGSVHIAAAITPFYIDREDGPPVMIDGQAIVELAPDRVTDRNRKRQFLLAHGITDRDRGWPRFEETAVLAGSRVTVVGQLHREPTARSATGESGFRDTMLEPRLIGNPQHPLVIGPAQD